VGIIAAFILIGCAAVTVVPAAVSLVLHALMLRKGRGSWLLFFAIALPVALLVAGAGVLAFVTLSPESGQGPPDFDDFQGLMWAAGLLGAAPGLGLSCGVAACLHRRPVPETP
jgi:hypothetical protein